MPIHELTEGEYIRTFFEPMRRLGADEDPPAQVVLKEYLVEAIRSLALPTTVSSIELSDVYVAGDMQHTHIVFSYGLKNRHLVVVVDNVAEKIIGHRVLVLA